MKFTILAFVLTLSLGTNLLALEPVEGFDLIPTNEMKNPWAAIGHVVSFQPQDNAAQAGFGTLIKPDVVITAAHVVRPIHRVVFFCQGKPHKVKQVLFGPNRTDTAYLVLEKPIEGVIPIPATKKPPKTGQNLLTFGWKNGRIQAATMPVTYTSGFFIESDQRSWIGDFLWMKLTPTSGLAEGLIEPGDSGAPWIGFDDHGQLTTYAVTHGTRPPFSWEWALKQKTYAGGAWRLDTNPPAVRMADLIPIRESIYVLVGILFGIVGNRIYQNKKKPQEAPGEISAPIR